MSSINIFPSSGSGSSQQTPAATKKRILYNYTKQQSQAYIREITQKYYAVYSWQLHSCFTHYHAAYSVPPSILATVSSFCLMVDYEYPLTVHAITEKLREQRLSSLQYNIVVRREVEKKKAFILEKLEELVPTI